MPLTLDNEIESLLACHFHLSMVCMLRVMFLVRSMHIELYLSGYSVLCFCLSLGSIRFN